MENTNQSSEVKTKNITLGSIVGWIFGVVAGLAGIFGIVSDLVPSIFFILAAIIALPPASKYLKEKFNLSLSKGVKIVLILVFVAIAGSQMDSSGSQLAVESRTESPKAEEPKVEALKVTAAQVTADYKANEVAADAKYKGKLLEISGTIETIGKDIADTPYVTFYTSEYAIIDKVQCAFSRSDEAVLVSLSKGQSITLQGTVSGKFGNIIVKGCKVVE